LTAGSGERRLPGTGPTIRHEEGDFTMKYLAISKGSKETEAWVPSEEAVASMGQYIAAAMSEGWLLATEGLHPSAKATRIKVAGDKRTITDGPFTEAKELIASYALLQVGSKEEAIEKSLGFLDLVGGGEIELWRVYEESDFS
jgi:hypothetical protein